MTDDLTRHTESFFDAIASQFARILQCEADDSEESRRRRRQYAEDGIDFARQFKRQLLYTTPETPSADLTFIANERDQSAGRFDRTSCYEKGRAAGMFIRYSSHISLKHAFSRNTL